MMFYSTRNEGIRVPLEQAVLDGLAADGGLFLPEHIKPFSPEDINQICALDFPSLAARVAERLLEGSIESATLEKLTAAAFPFEAKIVELGEGLYVHELFHGPTLAFKDFGARFLAQLVGYFAARRERSITVLVATSGDTGGAVAAGFFNTPGVRVALLYPKGRVSPLQEKQLTTFGGNIHAFEIAGSFDDCQKLVKTAFSDANLRKSLHLTSANSINIARLIPQSFYYFSAYGKLHAPSSISFAVPSGNFGNLTAGILSKRLGLPIDRLVAGTNRNDTVPRYLASGSYQPSESVLTISNAMDVGDPSNIERLNTLSGNSIERLRGEFSSYRFDDSETRHLIRELHGKYGYLADPHTAIAYGAALKLGEPQKNSPHVFLSTAHPIKFAEVIKDTLNISVTLPAELAALMRKEKHATALTPNYSEFQEALRAIRD